MVIESDISEELKGKIRRIESRLSELRSVVVAFSGGVDSSLLLKLSMRVLGSQCVAVIAKSASLPRSEFDAAVQLATTLGVSLEILETKEIQDSEYAENAPNRCFHCKKHVYGDLVDYAKQKGIPHVVDGMNAQDTQDLRPGRAAALKYGVLSPLCEIGFSKSDVREAARYLGLPNYDKPAAACLSSRISYGIKVTTDLLNQVEAAEMYLRSLGFKALRVRHHGEIARIEVPVEELTDAVQKQKEIVGGLKTLGWLYVTLDLEGLRQGSLNDSLLKKTMRAFQQAD